MFADWVRRALYGLERNRKKQPAYKFERTEIPLCLGGVLLLG
jgi:hypothetical protein